MLKDTSPEQLLEAIRVVAAGEGLLAPTVTRRLIESFAARAELGLARPGPFAG
jgi:DNA-binding NarL/FixJ family response regulator